MHLNAICRVCPLIIQCPQDKVEKDLILKLLLNLHNHLAHIAGSY